MHYLFPLAVVSSEFPLVSYLIVCLARHFEKFAQNFVNVKAYYGKVSAKQFVVRNYIKIL